MFLQNIKNNFKLNNEEKIKKFNYYNINQYNIPTYYHNKIYNPIYSNKILIHFNPILKKSLWAIIYEKVAQVLNEMAQFTHWH